MVQTDCIDMNAWYFRVDEPERPNFVLVDLDASDGGFTLGIRSLIRSARSSSGSLEPLRQDERRRRDSRACSRARCGCVTAR